MKTRKRSENSEVKVRDMPEKAERDTPKEVDIHLSCKTLCAQGTWERLHICMGGKMSGQIMTTGETLCALVAGVGFGTDFGMCFHVGLFK